MDVRVGLWRKLSAKELMLLNCGVGEDSWQSLDCKEIQLVHRKGDQSWIILEGLMLKLKFQYFDHLMQRTDSLEKTLMLGKIEGRRRRGREDEMVGWHRRLHWTWVWASSGSWWWTGKPSVLQTMGSQKVRHGWATEQQHSSLHVHPLPLQLTSWHGKFVTTDETILVYY